MSKSTTVIKRTGIPVDYDGQKVLNAVRGALNDSGEEVTPEQLEAIIREVEDDFAERQTVTVEELQDSVENALMDAGLVGTARQYIRYRQVHEIRRTAGDRLMSTFKDLFFADAADVDLKRDNANVNTDAPMGIMLKLGEEGSKHFVRNYVLSPEAAEADRRQFLHLHDLSFSLINPNCMMIDVLDLFKRGFSTGHGYLRPPQTIRSAAAQACIIIQSNQNDMHGGQAIIGWDYALAWAVRRTFRKRLLENLRKACLITDVDLPDEAVAALNGAIRPDDWDYADPTNGVGFSEDPDDPVQAGRLRDALAPFALQVNLAKVYRLTCLDVAEETKQACEAAIFNYNSLHSRAGAQVPFSSLNYGLDSSPEGRLVNRSTLDAIDAGLGKGETAIFPISIFQIKSGVNYEKDDPNYDLFRRACEVSARRLFPNFLNVDAPYNLQYYKPDDYRTAVTAMGCRTRIMSNVNGPEYSAGRGNFSFVTLNLPKIALEARYAVEGTYGKGAEEEAHQASPRVLERFYELYDEYIDVARNYLKDRFKVIVNKHVYNFPFLMGQGLYVGSKDLKADDTLFEALKHSTLSIGYCGLAECLTVLTGEHHGESEAAQRLGLEVIGHLRAATDRFTAEEHMNWSTFATPAESVCGTFQRANRRDYGVIKGVTDHEFMTNSNHLPVYFKTTAYHKIKTEAPYAALANAGSIIYAELDGDPRKNVDAFERIVRLAHDENGGYFSLNHGGADRCTACGYVGYVGKDGVCPSCGAREASSEVFEMKRINL